MAEGDEKDISALNERIKELTCLYEISSIAALQHGNLDEVLVKIVNRLPLAWMFPDRAVGEIEIDGRTFRSGKKPFDSMVQKASIHTDDQLRGEVRMHYPNEDKIFFLEEEQQLITNVALEISVIVERSERKKREIEIEQKLQHNDRLSILGEITAGIAHELNTPLANILGFAQFIHDSPDSNQTVRDSEKIIQSAIHAREVVKKLMFFSCDMPQKKQESSVNEVISDAAKLLMPTLQNAGVELKISPDPNDQLVRFDPVQFTQVIFNLVINAVHASKEGDKVHVSISSDKSRVLIEVKDQGRGIPKEIQSKIFEPFYTTKPLGEGSGLGLSVVHGIVRSHGGEISLESEEGSGTKFSISLPLTLI